MDISLDLHLHTHETIDARASTVEATCARAAAMGMREVAFTNHVVLGDPDYTIAPEAWSQHVADIRAAAARHPGLTIRLGLEVDYFPDRVAELRALLDEYAAIAGRPLDLVLGSIHHVWGYFHTTREGGRALFAGHTPAEIYPAYFDLLAEAAASGLFQVLAHPDCIKKRLPPDAWPWAAYREHAERAIEAAVAHGVALEVNTSGLHGACADLYPSAPFMAAYVAACRRAGRAPLVTIGCDSHHPATLGFALCQALALVRAHGITHLCTFQEGRPRPVPIEGWGTPA